jgi:hypothetical protein
LDSTGSGQGPVADYCECGDEPSGSCATELVSKYHKSVFLRISSLEALLIYLCTIFIISLYGHIIFLMHSPIFRKTLALVMYLMHYDPKKKIK